MYLLNVVAAALATGVYATTATFDDLTRTNTPVGFYRDVNWPGLTLVQEAQGDIAGAVKPDSGTQFAITSYPSTGSAPANASLIFPHVGRLGNFHFACYSAAAFAPIPAPCEFTVTGTCFDAVGTVIKVDVTQQFYSSGAGRAMKQVDMSGTHGGKAVRCASYLFSAIPVDDDENALPVGFFLDSVTFNSVMQH